jgi:hypothetical protein
LHYVGRSAELSSNPVYNYIPPTVFGLYVVIPPPPKNPKSLSLFLFFICLPDPPTLRRAFRRLGAAYASQLTASNRMS